MPAVPSSLLALASARSVRLDPGGLLTAFRVVQDPRHRRGVRYASATLLTVSASAVVAGSQSFRAIAEWVAQAPPAVLGVLGLVGARPDEKTIRLLLEHIDDAALSRAIAARLGNRAARRTGRRSGRRVIAVDGKTTRGARAGDERAPHLLAALEHTSGVVLGQVQVNGKTNEISAFSVLLDQVDIAGAVVTADALHTQNAHADYRAARGAARTGCSPSKGTGPSSAPSCEPCPGGRSMSPPRPAGRATGGPSGGA